MLFVVLFFLIISSLAITLLRRGWAVCFISGQPEGRPVGGYSCPC